MTRRPSRAPLALAARDAAAAGGQVDHIPGPDGLGDCARIRFLHKDAGTPGILVMGHFDTVHPIGTLESSPSGRRATCAGGRACWT